MGGVEGVGVSGGLVKGHLIRVSRPGPSTDDWLGAAWRHAVGPGVCAGCGRTAGARLGAAPRPAGAGNGPALRLVVVVGRGALPESEGKWEGWRGKGLEP